MLFSAPERDCVIAPWHRPTYQGGAKQRKQKTEIIPDANNSLACQDAGARYGSGIHNILETANWGHF